MKITDLKCAIIGNSPVVRIVTDEGIDGYGQVESSKPYLKGHILYLKDFILDQDPTNVERVVSRIRLRGGAFKPWGSAVSAVEMALWDVAGKAAGLPVYKLLGGKVRDRVRVYNGGIRFPFTGYNPEDFAADVAKMKAAPEGFTIIKEPLAFHTPMRSKVPGLVYGDPEPGPYVGYGTRGMLTERGFNHIVDCIIAMKEELGDEIGLALDCGPGWTVPDAIRLAKAVEGLHLMWLEDLITGDYVPWVAPDVFREVTRASTTPIHTGEQIYLRHNFKDLIEQHAVNIIGPDPADIGGLAELKWVAEHADMHGIQMAPHGINDGLIGLAALVQVSATLPNNYIAFEYPVPREQFNSGPQQWWYDIVDGLPDPIVRDGFIDVWDRPGLGVDFKVDAAREHLREEDKDFFD